MRRWALAVVAVLAAMLCVPAMSAAVTAGHTRLRITPAHPGTRSDVVVDFRQPAISDLARGQRTRETLLVTGPVRSGCASGSDLDLVTEPTGSLMRETLRPAQLTGHRWCEGVHQVVLTVTSSSACSVGVGRTICPEIVSAPLRVATARFHIAAR